jgi:transcriptional regulator with XRE-family HTH domain
MWLKEARKQLGWTQAETASRLGVSQGYVSLLEKNERRMSRRLVRTARKFFDVPAVASHPSIEKVASSAVLAKTLAGLGYEPLQYLGNRVDANPAEVLLSALRRGDLESRLTEALPWVAMRYTDLDWEWLLERAKVHDVKNRLGYVVSLARELSERHADQSRAGRLREQESRLTRSRLAEEGTLCQDSMTQVERRWLRGHRPESAAYWNLLTDLTPDKLPYAS